jgi:predicted dehydrogenase
VSVTVAVVGRGFGAHVHAPGWELAGARVVALAGREWREAIGDVEVVSIATPPATHAEVALEALRLGKAVLCEKPLATTLADAEELAQAAEGQRTAINFHYRAIPAFARFRELLDADELDVLWTVGSRLRTGRPSWKDDPLQGGALAAYGVHALDYARWLLGDGRVVGALIEGDEDAFSAVVEHHRGGRTTLRVSLVSETRVHRLNAGSLTLENRDPVNPVCPFVLRRDGVPLDVPAPALRAPAGADPRIEPFAALAAALLIDGERPTFTDGLQAQRLIDEVRRAAS